MIETAAALRPGSGAWREESLPLVYFLAKRALLGEQPFGNGQPLRQSIDAWRRKTVLLRPARQWVIGPVGPEVAAGVTREFHQRRDDVTRDRSVKRTQLTIDLGDERPFQVDSQGILVINDDEMQPLISFCEHPGDELDQAIRVVVEVIEQAPPRDILGARRVELRTCCIEIERHAAIDEARQCANLQGKWRAAHQRCAQRVDRLHLQAGGMGDQIPFQRRVALQYATRQTPGQRRVRFRRRGVRFGAAQCGHDAFTDLSGRLASERHGDNGLRPLDAREQGEVALNQELGLARAGRCLNDERA